MKKIKTKRTSIPTLRRLPIYLRELRKIKTVGNEYVSSAAMAKKLGIDPIVLRKDLAITGAIGKPRIGFKLNELINAIELFLGWGNVTDAFLVGAGNLGKALLGYNGFEKYGIRIIAAFDSNSSIIGKKTHNTIILDAKKISSLAKRMHVQIGILTAGAADAQNIADDMIKGGIKAIWNFTPTILDVPEHIIVQQEDLASSLAVLSHQLLGHAKNSDTVMKNQ